MTNFLTPFETTAEVTAMAQDMFDPLPVNEYPNLAEFVSDHVMQQGYDHGGEFLYGLDLIVNGLAKVLVDAERP